MIVQSDKIAQLSAEVDTLKTTLGEQGRARGDTDKDELIQRLESELANLRAWCATAFCTHLKKNEKNQPSPAVPRESKPKRKDGKRRG